MAPHDTSSDRTVEPSPDPWQAFGSLGAGVLLYGGAGWLADRFDLIRVVLIAALIFVLAQVVLALHPTIFVVGGF